MNRTDKESLARALLASRVPRPQRLVMAACMALADVDGFVKLDLELLAPLSGYRRMYVRPILDSLVLQGWLYALGDNTAKLTYGEEASPAVNPALPD